MKKKNKFSFRIIITFFSCLLIYQLVSLALIKAPLSRHPVDNLVYNLEHSTEFGKYVVLGDSITRDVLAKYKIKNKQIVNLTVDRPSGTIGSYFLLKRYLIKNDLEKKTKHVFFASTPEFFVSLNTGENLSNEVYLNSIFKEQNEIILLNKLKIFPKSYSIIENIKKQINFKENILEPIYGLIKNRKQKILLDGTDYELKRTDKYSEKNIFD